MNIPRFLQLYKEGRLEDAFLSVILDNPLPASTGRVCQHPCDDRCRRATMDEPVNQRDVHRLIADEILLTDKFEPMVQKVLGRRLEPTGHSVGIVGAGPAGLSCAYYLALLGHSVTVYESRPQAGGMLRYALPEYRLPKKVLDKEIELIERLGVKFEFGVAVGERPEPGRPGRQARDRLPLDRHLAGEPRHDARLRADRRDPGAALPGGRRARREADDRRARSWSSAAAMPPSTPPAPPGAWART